MSEWVRMEQEVSFVCLVHGYKKVDRSKLWWNGSYKLIGVKVSVITSMRSSRYQSMRERNWVDEWASVLEWRKENPLRRRIVQEAKICEQSKLWWNGSIQLIDLKVSVNHISEINYNSISQPVSEISWVGPRVIWSKETSSYDSDGGDEISSYSCWRLPSDPIADGMVPFSWLLSKPLSITSMRPITHQSINESMREISWDIVRYREWV